MKRALVYDWFSKDTGGGEKAFEAVYELFPSPIYTLFKHDKSIQKRSFAQETFHSSFVEKIPFVQNRYRSYLPLYPMAVEQLDLSSYELVLSVSHCVAKGVLTHADQLHLCYCFTPVRYAWDLYHQYIRESNLEKGWKGRLAQWLLHRLRMWDLQSAHRVDHFATISQFVSKRVEKTYRRESTVIYPPVDTDFFSLVEQKDSFYLTASRMVPYKKIDLLVDAFAQMPDKKLVVIGDGPDFPKIQAKASPNVELLGYQNDETLRSYLQNAKGFLFAAIEDFGILPVEAQSCGTPVIAYGRGGVLETVREGETGLFFQEQTPSSIIEAVKRFETHRFDAARIAEKASFFSKKRFRQQFSDWVYQKWETHKTRSTSSF